VIRKVIDDHESSSALGDQAEKLQLSLEEKNGAGHPLDR
jgi:hypothetical protein